MKETKASLLAGIYADLQKIQRYTERVQRSILKLEKVKS